MTPITLGRFISELERRPQDESVVFDFGHFRPTCLDSWRGIYAELALGYTEDLTSEVKVADLLKECRNAIGRAFQGYKGGEFTMRTHTPIHVANYGNSGHTALVGIENCEYLTVLRTEFYE